jgi:hypothetical protein
MDPDPALFVSNFEDAKKNFFFALLLSVGIFISVLKENQVIKNSSH